MWRTRRPHLIVLGALLVPMTCAVVWAAYRPVGEELWAWSPYLYALGCRRPLSEHCRGCPTLQQLDPDGDGIVAAVAGAEPERVESCGLSGYRVIGNRVAWGGGTSMRYFDAQGRLIAAYQTSDSDINRSTCRQSSAWYGPLVVCRYHPQAVP